MPWSPLDLVETRESSLHERHLSRCDMPPTSHDILGHPHHSSLAGTLSLLSAVTLFCHPERMYANGLWKEEGRLDVLCV